MMTLPRFLSRIAALLMGLAATMAQAVVLPPTFSPAAPNSRQSVTALVINGGCHGFLAPGLPGSGIPPRRIEFSPGIVDVIAPGIISEDPLCINPIHTSSFVLGALPSGNYQVRIWINEVSFGFRDTILVASAPLTVMQGPVAQSISTLGTGALIMTIVLVLLVALCFFHAQRRAMVLMLALLGCASASAQTEKKLMVLLSASPNAPNPIELVMPINFSAGYLGALTPGLAAENPTHAVFLLSQRATGDFATWLNTHPDEPRALSERYVVVIYPPTANLQNALTALAADGSTAPRWGLTLLGRGRDALAAVSTRADEAQAVLPHRYLCCM